MLRFPLNVFEMSLLFEAWRQTILQVVLVSQYQIKCFYSSLIEIINVRGTFFSKTVDDSVEYHI